MNARGERKRKTKEGGGGGGRDRVHSGERGCTHLTRRESVGRREWPLITIHDSLNCILYAGRARFLFPRVLREEVARPVSSYDRGTRVS